MSNTIKILFTTNYCCRASESELYIVKMFAPLPEEPEDEYDEDHELIEKIPVVYSEDQKKTIELYNILDSFRDSTFSVNDIEHVIVSYELVQAIRRDDERRIKCDFYFNYRAC